MRRRGSTAARAAALRAHPRHVVLAALVAGLLLGRGGRGGGRWPRRSSSPPLAGRPLVALLAAAAVLAGAALADARLAALDAGVLASMHGRTVETRAVLLEPVRDRARRPVRRPRPPPRRPGRRRAGRPALALAGDGGARPRPASGARRGGARGRRAVAATGGASGAARRGRRSATSSRCAGQVAPLGLADAYQRRRNAHAAIVAQRVAATGQRRGGLAGRARRGAAARRGGARRAGSRAPEAALLRGMVLGEDERLTEEVRDDFQRSGLAHILAVSGPNVMLLAVLVLGGLRRWSACRCGRGCCSRRR